MTLKQEQSIQTKKKILKAARNLAIEKGLDKMTIRDICKEVDLSIGAFYHHFNSKEDLVNESFMIYDEFLEIHLDKYDKSDPLDSLKSILLHQTEFVTNFDKQLVIEYYKSILLSRTKSAVSWERAYYKCVYDYAKKAVIQGSIKKQYTAEYLAEFFIKYVRGNIINWCLNDSKDDIMEETEREINLLFNTFVE